MNGLVGVVLTTFAKLVIADEVKNRKEATANWD